jgi:hypothetical protein
MKKKLFILLHILKCNNVKQNKLHNNNINTIYNNNNLLFTLANGTPKSIVCLPYTR